MSISTSDSPVVWQMLESEFIEWFAAKWTSDLLRRRQTPENQRWISDIAAGADWFLKRARTKYRTAIKNALRAQQPIPEHILSQDPSLGKMRDDYAAYLKGLHTSFANISVAVDYSLQPDFGCKVKRQDGKPITEPQIQEIADALREIEAVVGPLADLLKRIDATVSHTSGKHPFMSDAGGLFIPSERTISFGTKDRKGLPIKAFAHELGHLLDAEAGKLAGIISVGRRYLSDQMSEEIWLSSARRVMNTKEYILGQMAKARIQDVQNEEEKVVIERRRLQLGPYWRRPCELFARLFEQYVSTELNGAVKIAAEADYHSLPGWWTEETFSQLKADLCHRIDRRLMLLRDTSGIPSVR